MNARDKKLLIAGVLISVIIAAAAPFVASSNPDGLESTAGEFENEDDKKDEHYESPMPDYSAPGVKNDDASGVVAIVLGTFVMFIIVFALMYGLVLAKRKKGDRGKEENECN